LIQVKTARASPWSCFVTWKELFASAVAAHCAMQELRRRGMVAALASDHVALKAWLNTTPTFSAFSLCDALDRYEVPVSDDAAKLLAQRLSGVVTHVDDVGLHPSSEPPCPTDTPPSDTPT
jgi:hypothetical protein